MRDRFIEFADGITQAVSDLSIAQINDCLQALAAGEIECVGDEAPEMLRERLLIELCARSLGI
jgi:hypothetical protein